MYIEWCQMPITPPQEPNKLLPIVDKTMKALTLVLIFSFLLVFSQANPVTTQPQALEFFQINETQQVKPDLLHSIILN